MEMDKGDQCFRALLAKEPSCSPWIKEQFLISSLSTSMHFIRLQLTQIGIPPLDLGEKTENCLRKDYVLDTIKNICASQEEVK